MWIFTNDAFVSVVADPLDSARVLVRGRVVGDVLRFMAPAFISGLTEDKVSGTDYAVRASVLRSDFTDALAAHADCVTYKNFKSSVEEAARHDAYMGVWHVMHRLQNWCNPKNFGSAKAGLRKGKSINAPNFR